MAEDCEKLSLNQREGDRSEGRGLAEPFDFFVRGEGDLSFNELLEACDGKRELTDIAGMTNNLSTIKMAPHNCVK